MSTTTDPLVAFNELLLQGAAPDTGEFCAQYPSVPNLGRRIDALRRLRRDLTALERHSTAEVPDRIGDYTLLRELGRGGMGRVFMAEQALPRRHCALKLVRRDLQLTFERFQREANLAAKLDHPHVARVYAFGVEGDYAYLSTELVHGFSLRQLLLVADYVDAASPAEWLDTALLQVTTHLTEGAGAVSPPPVSTMVDVAMMVASGLGHAHERNVVHRDVKPSNIIVGFDGSVKLIDFGIALPLDGSEATNDGRITHTGVFIGSHDYAAPEQLRGEHDFVGPWTDVHALGATLYEMLTLRRPFEASNIGERLAQSNEAPRASPSAHNPAVPAALDHVVMKALEPFPHDRYRDGHDLALALEEARHATRRWPFSRWRTRPAERLRPTTWAPLIATLCLFAVGAFGYQAHRRSGDRLRAAMQALEEAQARQEPALASCYALGAVSKGFVLHAALHVLEGRVRRVELHQTEGAPPRVARCIEAALGLWRVPGVGFGEPEVLPVVVRGAR